MTQWLGIANSVLAIAYVIAFGLLAIARKAQFGLAIRLGLSLMTVGYLIAVWVLHSDPLFEDCALAFAGQLLVNLGMGVVIVTWLLRVRTHERQFGEKRGRRRSDYFPTQQMDRG